MQRFSRYATKPLWCCFVCCRAVLVCLFVCLCLFVYIFLCICLSGGLSSPAAPTVLVLSASAVMVRWSALPSPQLSGLTVMFYKVQYRRLGGRRKTHDWQTVDEDILPTSKLAVRINGLRPGQYL